MTEQQKKPAPDQDENTLKQQPTGKDEKKEELSIEELARVSGGMRSRTFGRH